MVKINTSFKKNESNNLHSAHNKLTNNLFNEVHDLMDLCCTFVQKPGPDAPKWGFS